MKELEFEQTTVDLADVTKPEDYCTLKISKCDLTNLDGIEKFTNLEKLSIYYCRNLTELSGISVLIKLKSLVLYSLPKHLKTYQLSGLDQLEHASYTNVKNLDSIKDIEKLPKLSHLGLSNTKIGDGDYSAIIDNHSLKRVFWFGAPFKSPALKQIKSARPDLVIGGNNAK